MLRILWCRGGINHGELPLVGQAVNGDFMHISDIKIPLCGDEAECVDVTSSSRGIISRPHYPQPDENIKVGVWEVSVYSYNYTVSSK